MQCILVGSDSLTLKSYFVADNPVLPKELEVFNHPCLPMSPLSEEDEDNSSPPSPTQSQSSMSNGSNPSSAVQKSYSDSPAPSVDSPAMGEGPSWESGVVRMYADGPKGLAGNGKEEKKYDELLPSDEADVSELFFLMCEY